MNAAQRPQHDPDETVSLQDRAMDNLSFIREAMLNSTSFTGVPGWGMVAMGIIALIGGWIATRVDAYWWPHTWGVVALVGCATGVVAMALKSRRRKTPILLGPGRKFMLNFSPPILVGCVLSVVFYFEHLEYLMPGMWLLLYGAAVINGGVFSVSLIPIMGICFMLIGVVAFLLPNAPLAMSGIVHPYDLALALGFGGLHIVFGIIVALRHGG